MAKRTNNYKELNKFFTAEYHALEAFVNSRVEDTADRDAEDIIQDVALNLFSRADQLSPIDNIAGFVYRSVRNKIIDVLRTRKPKLSTDEAYENALTEMAALFYGEDDTYPDDLKIKLKKAIINLKPLYKEVIIAVDFNNISYKQLSLETGIPQGTLMSRRHRALSLLFKELEV